MNLEKRLLWIWSCVFFLGFCVKCFVKSFKMWIFVIKFTKLVTFVNIFFVKLVTRWQVKCKRYILLNQFLPETTSQLLYTNYPIFPYITSSPTFRKSVLNAVLQYLRNISKYFEDSRTCIIFAKISGFYRLLSENSAFIELTGAYVTKFLKAVLGSVNELSIVTKTDFARIFMVFQINFVWKPSFRVIEANT